jgi:hypothetical protein
MAVLGPGDFGGPARGFADCGCGQPSGPNITQGSKIYVPTVESCAAANGGALPGNIPVTDAEYQCSFGVNFQPVLDSARRIVHAAGLRPYRVFLVWQQRNRQRIWEEVHRCELTPVRVVNPEGIELTTAVWGEDIQGGYTLEEVSPAQVDQDTLHGYLNGTDWAEKSTEREFFYEIMLHQRCPGAPLTPKRRRFIIAGEPYLNGQRFYWRVELLEQKVARSRGGVDQTIGTEYEDTTPLPFNRPTLVT